MRGWKCKVDIEVVDLVGSILSEYTLVSPQVISFVVDSLTETSISFKCPREITESC